MGHGSGGTAVLALLASPVARGLFQRAMSLSGSPRLDASLEAADAQWRASGFLQAVVAQCPGGDGASRDDAMHFAFA